MDYSIFLGPERRHIPDDKWDEYRAQDKMTCYSLVFRRLGRDGWYKATLVSRDEEIAIGQVFRSARRSKQWSVIPNPSHVDKTIVDGYQSAVKRLSQQGFATRLSAAEYLMRVQGFTDPLEW
jgi:hypothetical protein